MTQPLTPYLLYSLNSMSMGGENLNVYKDVFGEENTGDLLTEIPENSLVIPRLRAIPFGKELEREIANRNSVLINSYLQHRNIANLNNWVHLLEEYTPAAYGVHDIPNLPEGEYFVKGETNSKKNDWFGSCYAPDKKTLTLVVNNLQKDQYVGHQQIAIRPYQNYRKLGEAVDGRPIFNERRLFVLDGKLMTEAFYWSSHANEYGTIKALNPKKYWATIYDSIDAIKHLARFIVIDVAEYEDGRWGVVELNDGSMSGLSETSPELLWSKVVHHLKM